MSLKEIEIHPGHWINPGSGAVGILNEVIEARKIAKRVFGILKASNVPCTYYEDNTSTNQRQNINYLVNQHNKDRDSLIVSIHLNSGGDGSKAIGTEVLYYDQQALAARISKAISDATGGDLPNRGAKQRKDLGVLASTYEPAILIEVCFVNSVVDAVVYRRDFEKICYAIATELAKHIGKTLKPTTPPKTEHKREETQMTNTLTSTAKEDLKGLLKVTYQKGILKVDHSERVGSMTDGEALGLLISVVKRTL